MRIDFAKSSNQRDKSMVRKWPISESDEIFENETVFQIREKLKIINIPLSSFICELKKPNYDDVYSDAKMYNNIKIVELESKVLVLTKIKPIILFFNDSSKFPFIFESISFGRYYRNDKIDSKDKSLIANIKLGKKTCKMITNDYLTTFFFASEWTLEEQNIIINSLEECDIVATTKRNIRLEFIPENNINIAHFFVLLDVMTAGKISPYIITKEQEIPFVTHAKDGKLETKKHSFYIDGKKINIVRPSTNVFIKTDLLNTVAESEYISKMISELIEEYNLTKEEIINDYKRRLQLTYTKNIFKEFKKMKKTKQLVDTLRELEPKIFKNTSYTQKCQKTRQPHIVENEEEFIKMLERSLKDNEYWIKELKLKKGETPTLNHLMKKYEINDIKELLLLFPDETMVNENPELYSGIEQRYYSCIPRDTEKDKSHVFPGILNIKSDENDFYVPCCFKKMNRKYPQTKTFGMDYLLGEMRDLSKWRRGIIPQYLGSILGDTFSRQGVQKPNFISILDEVERVVSKNISRTAYLKWEEDTRNFTKGKTRSFIDSLFNNQKDEDFLKYSNLLSFILKKNVIIFETVMMYNTVLIFPKMNTTLFDYKDFIGIRINSIGELETIISGDMSSVHRNNTFVDYVKYVCKNYNDEVITI